MFNFFPVVSNDVDFLILFKNESASTKYRQNELNSKKLRLNAIYLT